MNTSIVYSLFSRRGIRNESRIIETSQFLAKEEIRNRQLIKLKQLLIHANKNVPYYRRIFSNIGFDAEKFSSFDEYGEIPLLTKDIIKNNFKELIATSMPGEKYIKNATGGSTGEPLSFFQDSGFNSWADAARVVAIRAVGLRPGDLHGLLWGAVRDINEDASTYEKVKAVLKYGEIQLNAFNMRVDRTREFIQWCQWLRPRYIRGYVTAIEDFARFIDETSTRFPKIESVIVGAETLSEDTRGYIEHVFKTPVYNTYGGRELSLIAFECKEKSGLHEVSENNYVEYEDAGIAGRPDVKELVITNLNNYAMPFIRYRIGDLGVEGKQEICACGRGLPRIGRVIGRTAEVFVFSDGTRIAGEMFIHLMKDFPVKEYQFVQKSTDRVLLKVKRNELDDSTIRKIQDVYKNYLPKKTEIAVEYVDKFEKTATGKFRFVYRDFGKS